MSRADLFAESLLRRLEAQLGPLGVAWTVRQHAANVAEMRERLPGRVENPQGLLVHWCNETAEAARKRQAKTAADRERYARLQVNVFRELIEQRWGPRELAKILDHCRRTSWPELNDRTIDLLRAMGNRWDHEVPLNILDGPNAAAARDAAGREPHEGPGRSDVQAGAQSQAERVNHDR